MYSKLFVIRIYFLSLEKIKLEGKKKERERKREEGGGREGRRKELLKLIYSWKSGCFPGAEFSRREKLGNAVKSALFLSSSSPLRAVGSAEGHT